MECAESNDHKLPSLLCRVADLYNNLSYVRVPDWFRRFTELIIHGWCCVSYPDDFQAIGRKRQSSQEDHLVSCCWIAQGWSVVRWLQSMGLESSGRTGLICGAAFIPTGLWRGFGLSEAIADRTSAKRMFPCLLAGTITQAQRIYHCLGSIMALRRSTLLGCCRRSATGVSIFMGLTSAMDTKSFDINGIKRLSGAVS